VLRRRRAREGEREPADAEGARHGERA
jgi:hypothetical protein